MLEALIVADEQQGKLQQARQNHQRVTDVPRQTEEHLKLHTRRQTRAQDARIELERDFGHTLRPTALLRLEGVNLDRHLRRRVLIQQVDETPSHQLCAEGEVCILRQRVVLPPARKLNRLATPQARRPVEVEEAARAVPNRLLDDEVSVEEDGLKARQQIVRAVDVRPAHLRAAHERVCEEVNELAQAVGARHEVGVEDGGPLALRRLQAVLQRAGLEARAVFAVDVSDVEAFGAVAGDFARRTLARLVGRVVEHLNLKAVARVVYRRHGGEQALNDVDLVEERELHGDARQLLFGEERFGLWLDAAVAPEVHDLLDAVGAVEREQKENDA